MKPKNEKESINTSLIASFVKEMKNGKHEGKYLYINRHKEHAFKTAIGNALIMDNVENFETWQKLDLCHSGEILNYAEGELKQSLNIK